MKTTAYLLILSAGMIVSSPLLSEQADDEEIRPYDEIVIRSAAGTTEHMRGELVSESFDAVEFKTRTGTIRLKTSEIQKIIRKRTPEQVYRTKMRKLPHPGEAPDERARANLELGLWCRTPHPKLEGRPPAAEHAFDHLLKAVQLRPALRAAYPHLIDVIAGFRRENKLPRDLELEIYLLAESGGFRDAEIDLRLGEWYLQMRLPDQAIERLSAVVGDTVSAPNASLKRQARRLLSSLFLERGEIDRALSVYESDTGDGSAEFERHYLSARLLLNRGGDKDVQRAREHLEKAVALQPDFPGASFELAAVEYREGKYNEAHERLTRARELAEDPLPFDTALAIVALKRRKFDEAEAGFKAVIDATEEGDRPELSCLSHLGLGLIREREKKPKQAIESFQLAFVSQPTNPLVPILLSRGLSATGQPDEARRILDATIVVFADDPQLFAAYAIASAQVKLAAGLVDDALLLLRYAQRLDTDNPYLLRQIGTLLLRSGRMDEGYKHLVKARHLEPDHPELWCASGYYHYKRGDLAAAEKAFRRVLDLEPRARRGAGSSPESTTRRYAELALERVLDAGLLEVWQDDFDRDAGDNVHRGWLENESFGVRISLGDQKVDFAGQQENLADGVTRLSREVDMGDIERISARLRFPDRARVRAGIRLEAAEDVGLGLVFFRDFDGTLRFSTRQRNKNWEDADPSGDTDPFKKKLVFSGTRKWPSDGAFHTLTIKKQGRGSKGRGLDLLLDGEPIAQNVYVGRLPKKGKMVLVGVSGQAENLDVPYRYELDDFRIFRRKAQRTKRGRR